MDLAFGVLVTHAKDNHPALCLTAFLEGRRFKTNWWGAYQRVYYERMFGGVVPWNVDINWEL